MKIEISKQGLSFSNINESECRIYVPGFSKRYNARLSRVGVDGLPTQTWNGNVVAENVQPGVYHAYNGVSNYWFKITTTEVVEFRNAAEATAAAWGADPTAAVAMDNAIEQRSETAIRARRWRRGDDTTDASSYDDSAARAEMGIDRY